VHIEEIVRNHWTTYGRNFYCRYDYEGVEKGKAEAVMKRLVDSFGSLPGSKFCGGKYEVRAAA
jgi:phosphoglucomutase